MRSFHEQPAIEPFHYQNQMKVWDSRAVFTHQLTSVLRTAPGVVLLCIGTDRCTGDALGPVTGSMLQENNPRFFSIYGTLAAPVHALNLEETLQFISKKHGNAPVLAIDASLGAEQKIGRFTFASGPVYPGSAVQKTLPPAGDMHITGIVNARGGKEFQTLQNTRLYRIWQMADYLADCLLLADRRLAVRLQPAASRLDTRLYGSSTEDIHA
ncbi:putative sporulation protein YyaC [Salsuginibacillus halophilus]|uniref:Putative sporulation protein YyaC n=1 Tax=Salsuginibacillus halophilus TaxID=517424 RepID=A0A2P8HI84_9BACI|nr:spore protease YyaC [Salsuginibacillus halophilus]PSL45929.1 putative sporulation protein YyaC [Salsuginibacillus halophilus]